MISPLPTKHGRAHHRPGTLLLTLCLAALAGGALVSAAPDGTDNKLPAPTDAARSFVLRAKAIYTANPNQPNPIENGIIIVRAGRIEAIGPNLPIPYDLPLVEFPDDVICPGFVAADSTLAGEHNGPQTVSGAYRAVDTLDRYADNDPLLALGQTTVHLDPGTHRLISGIGAVVKLAGPPDERIITPAADLTINLGTFDPPVLVKRPFHASADVAIEPAQRQRPDSRLGQFLELQERITQAQAMADTALVESR